MHVPHSELEIQAKSHYEVTQPEMNLAEESQETQESQVLGFPLKPLEPTGSERGRNGTCGPEDLTSNVQDRTGCARG